MAAFRAVVHGRPVILQLEPEYILGLYGIAHWRDKHVNEVLEAIAGDSHANLAMGVRLHVERFYREKHPGSRQRARANERAARNREQAAHHVSVPKPDEYKQRQGRR